MVMEGVGGGVSVCAPIKRNPQPPIFLTGSQRKLQLAQVLLHASTTH